MFKGPVKLSVWSALSWILLYQNLTWFQFSKPNLPKLTSVSTQVNALQKDFCYFKMSRLPLWSEVLHSLFIIFFNIMFCIHPCVAPGGLIYLCLLIVKRGCVFVAGGLGAVQHVSCP